MERRSKPGRSPIAKAVVLGTALVLALLFYGRVPETVQRINDVIMRLDAGQVSGDTLDDARKDSVRAAAAGFWTYSGPAGPNREIVDRIELQRTGIIWRVLDECLRLPSGDTFSQTTVEHSFLVPFAPVADDTASIHAQVAMLKRSRIYGGDTCYDLVVERVLSGFGNDTVELRESKVWSMMIAPGELVIDGHRYVPYGDPDLTKFFPHALIGIVDDIRSDQCPRRSVPHDLFRQAVSRDLVSMPAVGHDRSSVQGILDGYYVPHCLEPILFELAGGGALPIRSFDLDLLCASDGVVLEAKVSGGGLALSAALRETITREVMQWRFGAVPPEDGPWRSRHTIVM